VNFVLTDRAEKARARSRKVVDKAAKKLGV
jgi:hypothetical protein